MSGAPTWSASTWPVSPAASNWPSPWFQALRQYSVGGNGPPAAAPRRPDRGDLRQGAAVAAVIALVYLLVPGAVLGVFLDADVPADAAAFAVASQLLLVAAVLQFADSAQNIGVGLLRGLDDTAGAFRITLVGYWLVGLPVALLLGWSLGLGPVGVWFGLLGGLAATAALLLRRYSRALRTVPSQ
ncbi:MAG: MATE family efflux transporter [Pseudonocardiaceae bacterium]